MAVADSEKLSLTINDINNDIHTDKYVTKAPNIVGIKICSPKQKSVSMTIMIYLTVIQLTLTVSY